MNDNGCVYGLIAEFEDSESLVKAVREARDTGYKRIEAYSPYYVEGVDKALGQSMSFMPWLVLGGLVLGGLFGYFLQYWLEVPQYALNIGGRPFHSWPAFLISTFEFSILGGGLSALLGMVAVSGLPLPYHPVFNAEGFEVASSSGFFLCIEAADKRYDTKWTREFLTSLGPVKVSEVSC
jgi:hypothetical protein